MLELATLQYSDATSGWAGWALAHSEFWSLVNPITTRGQIMPPTLLLAHPNLKTQRYTAVCNSEIIHVLVHEMIVASSFLSGSVLKLVELIWTRRFVRGQEHCPLNLSG